MPRTSARIFTPLLAVFVAASAQAQKDRFEVGETVPVFTLKSVNPEDSGGEAYIGVDRYIGEQAKAPKKGVLVSFFATYCEPCKKEMPYLAALHDQYVGQGLQVLSISIDKEPDKIEFVRNLAKESNVKFPVLSDRFNIVAKRYLIEKLPCVYLLDAEGKVAMAQVGYNSDVSKEILRSVRTVVGEATSAPVPETLAKYMSHGAATADASGAAQASPAADSVPDAVDDPEKKNAKKKKKPRRKRPR